MAEKNEKLYFIAVVPNEEICTEVIEIKEYIADRYNSKHSLKSPPHITLHMPFKWKEEKEKILVHFLEQFSREQNSFDVKLQGFAAFPRRVIFIDVLKNENLHRLFSNLAIAMRKDLKLLQGTYKDQGFTAHMTVAHRDLKPAAFSKAWSELKDKQFEKQFLVDHLCLLKHNGKYWEIHGRFGFS